MLCSKRREFSMEFEDLFGLTCADIKNKKEKDTRILATFFADLISQESISFLVFQFINLQVSNESISDPAAFSTRVFLRALLQQLRKNLSETKLVKVLTHFENIPYTTQLFNFKSPKEFINAIKMYNAAGLPLFSEQVQKNQFQFDQNYKNSAHNNQFDSNSDSSDSDSDSSSSNPSYSDSDSSSDSDTIRRHRYRRRYSSSDSDSDSDHYRRSNRHDSSSSSSSSPPPSSYRRRDRSPPYNRSRGRSNSPPYHRNDNRSDSDDDFHPRRQNRRRVSPQYSPRRDYSPRDNDSPQRRPRDSSSPPPPRRWDDSPPRQRDNRRSNDSDMDDRYDKYDKYDDSRKGRRGNNLDPKQVKLNTSTFANDDSHLLPQLESIEPVSTANSKRLRPDSANEECGDAFQARPRHE
jgi:pre-mRNA-splicing factor CWC22